MQKGVTSAVRLVRLAEPGGTYLISRVQHQRTTPDSIPETLDPIRLCSLSREYPTAWTIRDTPLGGGFEILWYLIPQESGSSEYLDLFRAFQTAVVCGFKRAKPLDVVSSLF